MAYVIAAPEMMTAAASDLASIGSNVDAAHMVAAARTTSVIPAAADEVSAAIASVFANHAQAFQGLAGKAAAFQDQFVQTLKNGGAAYAQTEATSAAGLVSQLLSGIQNDLLTANLSNLANVDYTNLASALFFYTFIAAPIVLFLLFAIVVSGIVYFLTNPMQLIPTLMAWTPTILANIQLVLANLALLVGL